MNNILKFSIYATSRSKRHWRYMVGMWKSAWKFYTYIFSFFHCISFHFPFCVLCIFFAIQIPIVVIKFCNKFCLTNIFYFCSATEIPLTTRPSNSPGKKRQEPPPSYATLPKRNASSSCSHKDTNTLSRGNLCSSHKQQVSRWFNIWISWKSHHFSYPSTHTYFLHFTLSPSSSSLSPWHKEDSIVSS